METDACREPGSLEAMQFLRLVTLWGAGAVLFHALASPLCCLQAFWVSRVIDQGFLMLGGP